MDRIEIIRKITDTKDYCTISPIKKMWAEAQLEKYEKEIKSNCIDELLEECLKFKNQYKTFYYSDLVDIAKSIKEKMC